VVLSVVHTSFLVLLIITIYLKVARRYFPRAERRNTFVFGSYNNEQCHDRSLLGTRYNGSNRQQDSKFKISKYLPEVARLVCGVCVEMSSVM